MSDLVDASRLVVVDEVAGALIQLGHIAVRFDLYAGVQGADQTIGSDEVELLVEEPDLITGVGIRVRGREVPVDRGLHPVFDPLLVFRRYALRQDDQNHAETPGLQLVHVRAADECAARDREQRPAAIELVTDRRELLLQRPVSGGGTEMRPAPTTQRTSTNDRRALITKSLRPSLPSDDPAIAPRIQARLFGSALALDRRVTGRTGDAQRGEDPAARPAYETSFSPNCRRRRLALT
jgi:hypothetical protein